MLNWLYHSRYLQDLQILVFAYILPRQAWISQWRFAWDLFIHQALLFIHPVSSFILRHSGGGYVWMWVASLCCLLFLVSYFFFYLFISFYVFRKWLTNRSEIGLALRSLLKLIGRVCSSHHPLNLPINLW